MEGGWMTDFLEVLHIWSYSDGAQQGMTAVDGTKPLPDVLIHIYNLLARDNLIVREDFMVFSSPLYLNWHINCYKASAVWVRKDKIFFFNHKFTILAWILYETITLKDSYLGALVKESVSSEVSVYILSFSSLRSNFHLLFSFSI